MHLADVPKKLFDEFGIDPKKHEAGFYFAQTEVSSEVFVFWQENNFMLARVCLAFILEDVTTLYNFGGNGVPSPSVTIQAINNPHGWEVGKGWHRTEDIVLTANVQRTSLTSKLVGPIIKRYHELIYSPGVEPSSFWEVERHPDWDFSKDPRNDGSN